MAVAGLVVAVAFLAAAHLDELEELVQRVESGDPAWLALAVGLEGVSFGGYVVLTKLVYRPRAPRLGWIASLELTLAGVVATRLFSAGGAGGIAFTGWVLHRAGMDARTAARRLSAFMLLLYSVYVAALLLGGLLVLLGALGDVPTVLGAIALGVALGAIVVAVLMVRIPGDVERRAEALAARHTGMLGRLATRLSTVPQVAGNATRLALAIVRERPGAMLWPVVWWGFDVATLWACFEAFGDAPATGTLDPLLLPRRDGQPAADPGRGRRHGGRDGRRLRRLGRGRRARARRGRRLPAHLDLSPGAPGAAQLHRPAQAHEDVGGCARAVDRDGGILR